MNFPAPIQSFFEADAKPDGDAPLTAFAADAVVHDEGKTHVGHPAIEAWWRAAKAQFQHQSKPRELSRDGEYASVLAEVRGNFPGSPALLTFAFQLKGDEITNLEISA